MLPPVIAFAPFTRRMRVVAYGVGSVTPALGKGLVASWGGTVSLGEWALAPFLVPLILAILELGYRLTLVADRGLRFEAGWLYIGRLRVRPEGIRRYRLLPVKGHAGIWECIVLFHIGFPWEEVRSWSMLIDDFAAAKAFRSTVLADISAEDRCGRESGDIA